MKSACNGHKYPSSKPLNVSRHDCNIDYLEASYNVKRILNVWIVKDPLSCKGYHTCSCRIFTSEKIV